MTFPNIADVMPCTHTSNMHHQAKQIIQDALSARLHDLSLTLGCSSIGRHVDFERERYVDFDFCCCCRRRFESLIIGSMLAIATRFSCPGSNLRTLNWMQRTCGSFLIQSCFIGSFCGLLHLRQLYPWDCNFSGLVKLSRQLCRLTRPGTGLGTEAPTWRLAWDCRSRLKSTIKSSVVVTFRQRPQVTSLRSFP
jgi:hypothetical protein